MKTPVVLWQAAQGFAGMCDRIRSLAAMLHVAGVYGADTVILRWPRNEACPFGFAEAFDCNFVIELDAALDLDAYDVAASFDHPANAWCDIYCATWPGLFPDYATFSRKVTEQMQRMFTHCRLNESFARWKSGLGLDDRKTIGIHLRRTDNVSPLERIKSLERMAALDAAMIEEIKITIAREPQAVFCLATDSRKYASWFTHEIMLAGGAMVTYPKDYTTGHLRQTNLEGLMGDILALSSCRLILCSCPSSILLVSQRINCTPAIREVTG